MPSGPGLGHFCFHNKQRCSGYGRASEYKLVEPNLQTNRTSKKQKQKNQMAVNRCLQLHCGQRAAAGPGPGRGSLDLSTALSYMEAEGQMEFCRACSPGEWFDELSLLCVSPKQGMWQRRKRRVIGCSTSHISLLVWCSSQNKEIPWEQKSWENSYLGIGNLCHTFIHVTWCKAQKKIV